MRSFPVLLSLAAACGAPTESAPPPQAQSTVAAHEGPMVIRVLLQVKSTEREAFVAAMTEDARHARSRAGCERFELFASPGDEARFLIYEEWSSKAAFEEYQQSDQLRQAFATLGPMLAGPPESAYFEASQVGP